MQPQFSNFSNKKFLEIFGIILYNQVNKGSYIYINLVPAQHARALKEIVTGHQSSGIK